MRVRIKQSKSVRVKQRISVCVGGLGGRRVGGQEPGSKGERESMGGGRSYERVGSGFPR